MEFNQLGIIKPILKVLQEEEYSIPTPIQEKTIPSALAGKDVLGLAQTGTGKTAAFSIPTLQLLAEKKTSGEKRRIRALVLTPTRELALQVYESFTVYGRYLHLKSTVIFGGVSQGKQVTALKNGVDILVATPGRLIDLINQGFIDISGIEFFILDEADRMLDMGFIHDVRRIMQHLPAKKQTMLFSATMPAAMEEIADRLLVNPVEVSVSPASSTVDIIEQSVYYVDQIHKIDILVELLREFKKEPVLIFTRTKGGADRVVKNLSKENIKAMAIHGNKSQNARQNALESFKNSEICALVATDIASRGIDINELKYVINFDLPEVPETYVHRIGRTGRAGNEGIAVSFCSYQEQELLRDIEKLIKKKIKLMANKKYPMVDMSPKEKKPQRGARIKSDKETTNKNEKPRQPKREGSKREAPKRDSSRRDGQSRVIRSLKDSKNRKVENEMGNKNIKKEVKKPKKTDKKPLSAGVRSTTGTVTAQPVLIEKVKRPK